MAMRIGNVLRARSTAITTLIGRSGALPAAWSVAAINTPYKAAYVVACRTKMNMHACEPRNRSIVAWVAPKVRIAMAETAGIAGSHCDMSKTTRPIAIKIWRRTNGVTNVGEENNRHTAQNHPIKEANVIKFIVIGRAVLSTSSALKIRL